MWHTYSTHSTKTSANLKWVNVFCIERFLVKKSIQMFGYLYEFDCLVSYRPAFQSRSENSITKWRSVSLLIWSKSADVSSLAIKILCSASTSIMHGRRGNRLDTALNIRHTYAGLTKFPELCHDGTYGTYDLWTSCSFDLWWHSSTVERTAIRNGKLLWGQNLLMFTIPSLLCKKPGHGDDFSNFLHGLQSRAIRYETWLLYRAWLSTVMDRAK